MPGVHDGLRREHCFPMSGSIQRLIDLELPSTSEEPGKQASAQQVFEILARAGTVCVLTWEEQRAVDACHKTKAPSGSDPEDPHARYLKILVDGQPIIVIARGIEPYQRLPDDRPAKQSPEDRDQWSTP